MDEVQKKSTSTGMDDESAHDHFSHLKRLKEGYASIVDKHGYGKFKPYLQRLFQSVEKILMQEVTEFKKIDAKYQDMVRQCHIYEKTLAMLKENNPCELSTFSESSNTYAFEDFTKVTPYLAPDLLQSTLGNGGAGSTSIQFRLPRRRSSLSSRQYVSTPLGPARTNKPAVPLAHFDDESSLVLTNSLGFPQQPPPPAQEKQFVDASTSPEPIPSIELHDFSCQTAPTCADKDIETCPLLVEFQSTQTDLVATETVACQFNPTSSDCSMQTAASEQHDFACQFYPHTVDQTTETLRTDHQTQDSQTDATPSTECACQVTPDCADQGVETTPVLTQDIALQSSFDSAPVCDNQQIQTDSVAQTDACTQYEPEVEQPSTTIIPVVFSEELPVSHEIEISHSKVFADQECQTLNSTFIQSNECTQTPQLYFNDCASQSTIVSYTHCNMQTEPDSSLYSSSVYIAPTVTLPPSCSTTVLIVPKEVYSPATLVDVEVQCDLGAQETSIAVEVEPPIRNADRRSIIQHQMDEKEKQMNRIIEEYAMLYGEFESERRRNMDLTEARDRLADHIKVLSDELGDREINEEKLLIKSCQQSKLINYMLPQIDCSPVPKKKHNSATSFRRLLPKFK